MDILKGREGISKEGLFISRVLGHCVPTQLRVSEHHRRRSRIGSCYGNEALRILRKAEA